MRLHLTAAFCATLMTLSAGRPLHAHDGHDHAGTPTATMAQTASRGEAVSDNFEMLVVARDRALEIFLDRVSDNAPIGDATLEIETPQGPVQVTASPDQVYRVPAPWLAASRSVDLIVTATLGDITDILPVTLNGLSSEAAAFGGASPTSTASHRSIDLPGVAVWGWPALTFLLGIAVAFIAMRRRGPAAALAVVLAALSMPAPGQTHEGHDHAAPAAASTGGDLAARSSDGIIFVPKPTQRIFGVRTVTTEAKTHFRSVELPGRIVPDPNASGFVQASVGGRLSAPAGGFPRLGAIVAKGDVLAYVTPPLQAIDVSDMRQRQGEIDQQISIVQRRIVRLNVLVPTGAAARSQLEEAELEMQGLSDRRRMLDQSRREPEALVAPVSGVIADGSAVAGQIAQSNAMVFHIVDPARLWVEALSFEPVGRAQDASATTAQGRILRLSYRGSGFADRNQSIPVHFAVEGGEPALRSGQFVSVVLRTDEERAGISVPRSALVRGPGGVDFVLEKVGAERFVPRPVRAEPLDGESVLLTAGITAGARIVSQGAELLSQVR